MILKSIRPTGLWLFIVACLCSREEAFRIRKKEWHGQRFYVNDVRPVVRRNQFQKKADNASIDSLFAQRGTGPEVYELKGDGRNVGDVYEGPAVGGRPGRRYEVVGVRENSQQGVHATEVAELYNRKELQKECQVHNRGEMQKAGDPIGTWWLVRKKNPADPEKTEYHGVGEIYDVDEDERSAARSVSFSFVYAFPREATIVMSGFWLDLQYETMSFDEFFRQYKNSLFSQRGRGWLIPKGVIVTASCPRLTRPEAPKEDFRAIVKESGTQGSSEPPWPKGEEPDQIGRSSQYGYNIKLTPETKGFPSHNRFHILPNHIMGIASSSETYFIYTVGKQFSWEFISAKDAARSKEFKANRIIMVLPADIA